MALGQSPLITPPTRHLRNGVRALRKGHKVKLCSFPYQTHCHRIRSQCVRPVAAFTVCLLVSFRRFIISTSRQPAESSPSICNSDERNSEQILERDLDLTRRQHGTGRAAETGRLEDADRDVEIRAIPNVEQLRAKRQRLPFYDAEVFDERDISVGDAGGAEDVAP